MSSQNRDDQPVVGAAAAAPPSKTQQTLAAKQKYIENYDFQYCDESIKYEKVAKIGQGTFG